MDSVKGHPKCNSKNEFWNPKNRLTRDLNEKNCIAHSSEGYDFFETLQGGENSEMDSVDM